ncbi:class I adenylate-forming enzyme family protein [uncultured Sphingomonas sp.]|uniref:class I adenylate-forming enzyme family protein n=1 Tax=uncultured Sphingomonas sp. TaxID=158754 RepID=UPI0035CB5BDA
MTQRLLVGDIIRTAAVRTPARRAAWHGDRAISFAEAAASSEAVAQALLALGIGRGDRVVWIAETCLDAVMIHFGTALIGAIFTPLNPKAPAAEIDGLIAHAEPALVLGDEASGRMTLDMLLARHGGAGRAFPDVEETDAQVMYYTSGTTGDPKGCLLSHRTQRLRIGVGSHWPVPPTVVMFPQFHMAGWTRALRWWLQSSTIVYVDRAEAGLLIEAIDRHRCDALRAIPAVLRRIVEADRGGHDLSCLRSIETGTSMVTSELIGVIRDAFPGVAISIAYGSTEAGSVCTLGPDDIDRKPGSVGLPVPGVTIEEGANGEMLVASPTVFDGYFRNEAATAAAFERGLFRTGDLATTDDEGYRSVVGRAGDLIRSGGEWISPAEVESVLQAHPAIADAAVVGAADPDWGQVVTAFVVARADATITIDMLRTHCAATLAPHKHPRRLKLVDSLPRTPATGQVQRRLLEA